MITLSMVRKPGSSRKGKNTRDSARLRATCDYFEQRSADLETQVNDMRDTISSLVEAVHGHDHDGDCDDDVAADDGHSRARSSNDDDGLGAYVVHRPERRASIDAHPYEPIRATLPQFGADIFNDVPVVRGFGSVAKFLDSRRPCLSDVRQVGAPPQAPTVRPTTAPSRPSSSCSMKRRRSRS